MLEAVTPKKEVVGFIDQEFTLAESLTNPSSFRVIADHIPSGGVNLPNGTEIQAVLVNSHNDVVETQRAYVRASPFMWGVFSR